MFGLNLEANLYLESVSKFLSGCFPVLKRESLLIIFFIKLRKKKKKKRKQSFFKNPIFFQQRKPKQSVTKTLQGK